MSGLVWICMVFYTNLYCLVQFSTVPYWLVLSTTVLFSPSGVRVLYGSCTALYGHELSRLAFLWSNMVLGDLVWSCMILNGTVLSCTALCGLVCSCMFLHMWKVHVPNSPLQSCLILCRAIYSYMYCLTYAAMHDTCLLYYEKVKKLRCNACV